jgi:hypothetical protein
MLIRRAVNCEREEERQLCKEKKEGQWCREKLEK